MHFPKSSSPAAAAVPACQAQAKAEAAGGQAVGTHAALACPVLPVTACLMTSLSSLLRPVARLGQKTALVAEVPEATAP